MRRLDFRRIPSLFSPFAPIRFARERTRFRVRNRISARPACAPRSKSGLPFPQTRNQTQSFQLEPGSSRGEQRHATQGDQGRHFHPFPGRIEHACIRGRSRTRQLGGPTGRVNERARRTNLRELSHRVRAGQRRRRAELERAAGELWAQSIDFAFGDALAGRTRAIRVSDDGRGRRRPTGRHIHPAHDQSNGAQHRNGRWQYTPIHRPYAAGNGADGRRCGKLDVFVAGSGAECRTDHVLCRGTRGKR
jgi:hypothetical protein